MSRNVHKEEVSLFTLPQDAIQEDRGLSTCGVPQLVLASVNDVISYKNDRTAVGAYKFDTMTVQLEDKDGNLTSAAGVAYSLPAQPDALAFTIDWRQVTDGGGQLIQGCYKVRVNWTKSGNSGWFYKGAYQLLEYSVFNARGTSRIYYVLNDFVEYQSVNYKDSGFAGTIRFKGVFGYMQPNFDTVNNIHTDKTEYKVSNIAKRTYELRSSFLLGCMTEAIDEILLAANQIYISDHNAAVHKQYYDFPVVLHNEESPNYEYPERSVYATINAKFFKKKSDSISKYDGSISGSENIILELPTTVASCPVGNVTLDSAALATVPSGSTVDVQLEDQAGATITPTSIVGGVITVDQTPPPQRKTAQLMKTGDTSDGNAGRDTDWFTLDSAPVHDNQDPTANTTTNKFTDELGGQTYANNWVIDWSTFNGSTVLGYHKVLSGIVNHADALIYCAGTLGTFSGCRLANYREVSNAVYADDFFLNYSPYSLGSGINVWTNTEYHAASTLVFYALNTNNIRTIAKTTVGARALAVRDFTVTGTILT